MRHLLWLGTVLQAASLFHPPTAPLALLVLWIYFLLKEPK